jgi:hypothetical protein
VIEDTESSVTLPHCLASATPPDGSLLIQRTRWANGGLIILPAASPVGWFARPSKMVEGFPYTFYPGSIAAVNIIVDPAWSHL